MTTNDTTEQLDAEQLDTEAPEPTPETVPVGTSVPVYDAIVQRPDGTVIGRCSGGFVVTEPGTYRFHGEGAAVLTITATQED